MKIMINMNKQFLFIFLMIFPVLPQNLYVLDNLNIVNFYALLLVGWFFIRIVISRKAYRFYGFRWVPFFWVFMLVTAIYVFATSDFMAGLAYIISNLFICLIIVHEVRSSVEIEKAIDAVIWGGVVIAIIGIFETLSNQYIFQYELLQNFESNRYGLFRATVFFGNPILFGLYQVFVAGYIRYKIKIKSSLIKNQLYYIMYILSVIAVFCSGSRLAIIYFVSTQLWITFINGMSKKRLLIISLLMMLLLGIISMSESTAIRLIDDLLLTVKGLITQSDVTDSAIGYGNRIDLYQWVLEDIVGNEVFGLGMDALFSYKMFEWFTKTSIEVHYLYVLFRQGYIGLILLVISYANIILFYRKQIRHHAYLKRNDSRIEYIKISQVLMVCYFIALFGVQETDLSRLTQITITLSISSGIYLKNMYKGHQTTNYTKENKNEEDHDWFSIAPSERL